MNVVTKFTNVKAWTTKMHRYSLSKASDDEIYKLTIYKRDLKYSSCYTLEGVEFMTKPKLDLKLKDLGLLDLYYTSSNDNINKSLHRLLDVANTNNKKEFKSALEDLGKVLLNNKNSKY